MCRVRRLRKGVVLRARRALLTVLLERGEASADDVRAAVALPEGVNAKVFVAVPGTLAELRLIEHVGFAKTNRKTAHARPISIWRLLDRVAALTWLATHPDPEELPEQSDSAEQLTLFNMAGSATTDGQTSVGLNTKGIDS